VPPQHPQFLYIQKLRELGVTLGCTATRFCPDGTVTRAEAAAMLARARLGVTAFEAIPADPSPCFEDVPGTHRFFSYVQRMKQDGITVGCTASRYCPDDPVTNGSAAALVVRAFFTQ
jgi:hypothetical protein